MRTINNDKNVVHDLGITSESCLWRPGDESITDPEEAGDVNCPDCLRARQDQTN